jgi:hypothetical protein
VRLARLAHKRWFRTAWETGTLHVAADDLSRRDAWTLLAIAGIYTAVCVPAGLKVLIGSRAWDEFAGFSTPLQAGVLVAAGVWLLVLSLPCLLLWTTFVRLRRSQLMSIEFDARQIRGKLRCGSALDLDWTQIKDLRLGSFGRDVARLQLDDGQTLHLGPLPRHVAKSLERVRAYRFPRSVDRDRRRKMRANLILFGLSLFAAAGTGVLAGYLGQDPQAPTDVSLIIRLVLVCVGVVSAAWFFLFIETRRGKE